MKNIFVVVFLLSYSLFYCQVPNKFEQLGQLLPTPNSYRTASGQPGHEYWQQQVDYEMDIQLDDDNQIIRGKEKIVYTNNSPDDLHYLWIQLDQNVRSHNSLKEQINQNKMRSRLSTKEIQRMNTEFDGGFKIETVTDRSNNNLSYTINNTMMRVDLNKVLQSGQKTVLHISWWYNINNTSEIGGRSGYEHFEEDGNNVYVIAQFFPRLCKYNDYDGWQNKQFLGRGEFALEFGNYKVNITTPTDHLVAASGVLTNESEVLSPKQIKRLNQAKNEYEQPVYIATLEETQDRVKQRSTKSKTWKFEANNVRDFAFASSRRFIWDAMNTKLPNGKTAMAMSMWINEGHCLWSKYSTKAVAHTLKWYSHYTIDYPYPVAWSIDGNMGMEYPMICFNYGRCQSDNTYSKRMKYGHIGVIIHEVGHNFFPMIINSDERQWTWMDEGLNTFVQYLTEQQWERNYPYRRGPAQNIVEYMGGDKSRITPIMTNSEAIYQFGNNAYGKPATGLNILRETILGRELFDYAFKEYARRWAFKSPTPADLFRTIEDASGVDLDWFWRAWFYTTEHVDIGITGVRHFKVEHLHPEKRKENGLERISKNPTPISIIRNKKDIIKTYSEIDSTIIDFYSSYDPLEPNNLDYEEYEYIKKTLSTEEIELLEQDYNYYEMTFTNIGGHPMPIILEFVYTDGNTEIQRIPAEIWRYDDEHVSKVFVTEKKISTITLDPYLETADVDRKNNYFPNRISLPSRFEIFKQRNLPRGDDGRENAMQRDARAKMKRP